MNEKREDLIATRDYFGRDLHIMKVNLETNNFEDNSKEELIKIVAELQEKWNEADEELKDFDALDCIKINTAYDLDFKRFKEQSKKMFDTANDVEYLLCESVSGEIDRAVITQFLETDINKKDFQVLNVLMNNYYKKEESVFIVRDLNSFILDCDFSISKPNLSRSLKALEQNGFIRKMANIDNNINYKFITAFKKLEELT